MASCSSTSEDLPESNQITTLELGERVRVLQHYKNVIFGDHYPGVISENSDVVRVELIETGVGTEIYIIAVKEGETRIAYVPVRPKDPNSLQRIKDFSNIPPEDIRTIKVIK